MPTSCTPPSPNCWRKTVNDLMTPSMYVGFSICLFALVTFAWLLFVAFKKGGR